MRYSSLMTTATTSATYNPNEFSVDVAYSRLFSEHWSGGVALRFIYSNITGGQ
ncbi:MAG: hypothetical protein MZV63_35425 [Marinilabiliales bacterium]|nr:hypothetical protein [Marinilabiliales bacterium]